MSVNLELSATVRIEPLSLKEQRLFDGTRKQIRELVTQSPVIAGFQLKDYSLSIGLDSELTGGQGEWGAITKHVKAPIKVAILSRENGDFVTVAIGDKMGQGLQVSLGEDGNPKIVKKCSGEPHKLAQDAIIETREQRLRFTRFLVQTIVVATKNLQLLPKS